MSEAKVPPGDAQSMRGLLQADWAAGRDHEAVERMRERVGADPDDAEAWRLLAEATARVRRWDDLANAMAHALERFPSEVWVWTHLVGAALGLGDPEDAVRVGVAGLRAVSERPGPEVAELWQALGHAWWALGDHRAVLHACEAMTSLGGDTVSADLFSLRVAIAHKDHEKAKVIGERLLDARPDAFEPLALLTAALIGLGDGPQALARARRLSALDPASPTIAIMVAAASALVGDFAGACRSQKRALELMPDDEASRMTLAVYQLAAQQPRAATQTALGIARRHPSEAAAWRILAETSRALAVEDLARRCEALVTLIEAADDHARDERLSNELLDHIERELVSKGAADRRDPGDPTRVSPHHE